MTQELKKQPHKHELKRVTRPLRIEQDPAKRKNSQFKHQGATITMAMCQVEGCDYQVAVDYEILK